MKCKSAIKSGQLDPLDFVDNRIGQRWPSFGPFIVSMGETVNVILPTVALIVPDVPVTVIV